MPSLGIVDSATYESELIKTPTVEGLIKQIERGRGKGRTEVPEELRKIIGGEGIESGTAEAVALANSFGLSRASATSYINGSNSTKTYNKRDLNLEGFLNKTRERVTKKASKRLIQALDSMTEDKLMDLKPTDAAVVASAMSRVIKDVTPETKPDTGNRVQFHIFAPQVHTTENHYDAVRVDE